MRFKQFIFFFITLVITNSAFAQSKKLQDSNYISHFERRNVVEVYTGFNFTNFNFNGLKKAPSSFRLAANTNAYMGFNFNYKWASVSYSFAIPGTRLDNNIRLKHVSASFRYNYKQWSIIPSYNFYNGLLLQNNEDRKDFDPFRDMNYYDAGFKLLHFSNIHKYSYKSATSFSEQQIKPVGSIIIMAVPRWQSIRWKNPSHDLISDSLTYNVLASNPQWVSLTLGGGYNYNFIFNNGKWIISPAAIIGAGALKEIQRQGYVQPIFDAQAWVNAGYNGDRIYYFVRASWENTQTKLLIKNLNAINRGISFTIGYRFKSLPKTIFGIL